MSWCFSAATSCSLVYDNQTRFALWQHGLGTLIGRIPIVQHICQQYLVGVVCLDEFLCEPKCRLRHE